MNAPGGQRRPIIAGNIKMFLTIDACLELLREVWSGLDGTEAARVIYFPPFTCVPDAARLAAESPISIGGQNMFWESEGAFTGEISPRQLLDAGASFVLIGHSERRTLFGETDAMVNRKIRAALVHGLKPVVCIGETLEEREGGRTGDVLARQVRDGLAGFTPEELSRLVIAYEPVWAIGTGRTATPEQADEAHALVRRQVAALGGSGVGAAMQILYGGSVKAENARALLAGGDVDGALVGGACLKPDSFLAIIRAANG